MIFVFGFYKKKIKMTLHKKMHWVIGLRQINSVSITIFGLWQICTSQGRKTAVMSQHTCSEKDTHSHTQRNAHTSQNLTFAYTKN